MPISSHPSEFERITLGPEAGVAPPNHRPMMVALAEGIRHAYRNPSIDGSKTAGVIVPINGGNWRVAAQIIRQNRSEITLATATTPEDVPGMTAGSYVLNRSLGPFSLGTERLIAEDELDRRLYADGGILDEAMGTIAPAELYGIGRIPDTLSDRLHILSKAGSKIPYKYTLRPHTPEGSSETPRPLYVVYKPGIDILREGVTGNNFKVCAYSSTFMEAGEDPREHPEAKIGEAAGETLIRFEPAS